MENEQVLDEFGKEYLEFRKKLKEKLKGKSIDELWNINNTVKITTKKNCAWFNYGVAETLRELVFEEILNR